MTADKSGGAGDQHRRPVRQRGRRERLALAIGPFHQRAGTHGVRDIGNRRRLAADRAFEIGQHLAEAAMKSGGPRWGLQTDAPR